MKNNILIRFILIGILFSVAPSSYGRDILYDSTIICDTKVYNPRDFLRIHSIDLSTRSLRGWMRVLNSKEKREDYGLFSCEEKDLFVLKEYIKQIKTAEKQSYDRRLK